MRLVLDPRARRLLRRVPRTTVYSAMELVLLSVLALQCARLFWALVTPVGPIGDWEAPAALQPPRPASTALLGSFDPFFRINNQGAAPAVVTSLNLKLFGVREDRASGRGSAIIATPEGQQRSFAVGEEIVPGVTLVSVGFDHVIVSRAGTNEQLFLDQSSPAERVGPASPASGSAPPAALTTLPPPPMVTPPPPGTGNGVQPQLEAAR